MPYSLNCDSASIKHSINYSPIYFGSLNQNANKVFDTIKSVLKFIKKTPLIVYESLLSKICIFHLNYSAKEA
jgi:hypothetical protein